MGISFKRRIRYFIEAVCRGYENADVALRYLPIADSIRKGPIPDPKILELGSGVKGVACYVPNKIVGVDISFNERVAKNLQPVLHEGVVLPFPDRSFDYVLSVDMLEHVPSDQRRTSISEMMRVARSRVYIAVPCGPLAEKQDRDLDALFTRLRGKQYFFFKDHVENGLPSLDDMLGYITQAGNNNDRSLSLNIANNVNLKLRWFFMKLWVRPMFAPIFLMASICISLFWPFTNKGECYRQLFVIDLD
jgi:hypothetical protein